MSLEIRRAITVDARIKPDYSRIRVPVLAIYQAQEPFEKVAAGYSIHNEQERSLYARSMRPCAPCTPDGRHDLRAAVPTARIVELTFANPFLFLSNEADVLREIRAFAATLTGP
jgi:hypothetical protein